MFLGGGESPEKLDKGSQNVHFSTSENELPLQKQEEPGNMPTSPSNKPILEGTLIYRKDGRRLKTKNLRTVSYFKYFCLFHIDMYIFYCFANISFHHVLITPNTQCSTVYLTCPEKQAVV